ncbi:MAG: hypothetical protein FWE86_02015 [Oscillospiraceae bacterium]|nr:hypothetical protein [Oscillospiraceae bacterium]
MKKLLIMTLLLALAISGCKSPADLPENVTGTDAGDASAGNQNLDFLEGLIKNEYDGIEITAEMLERMAILPGMPIPITVVVTNTGDKSVFYVQGSGSFETPEALFLKSDELQTVRPSDQLGIMTMDFVTKELKPGESLHFKLYAMAIEPNENFDEYTFELFAEGTYIAEMDWLTLNERYPDLVAAEPGSYTVNAYFLYTVAGEDGQNDAFVGATGYAQAEAVIGVS